MPLDYTITISQQDLDARDDANFWRGYNYGAGNITLEKATGESVFCDTCSTDDFGTREQLVKRGWTFTKGAEFCSDHF